MTVPVDMTELAELGYDPRWLEWGFLDAELFREQLAANRVEGDPNTEHYRYPMFLRFLARAGKPSASEIEHFIALAAADPDPVMREAALGDLIDSKRLPGRNLEELRQHPSFQIPHLQRRIRRRTLLTEIADGLLTDELVNACIEAKDDHVQRAVLVTHKLSRPQLAALMEKGINRAIRNLASRALERVG